MVLTPTNALQAAPIATRPTTLPVVAAARRQRKSAESRLWKRHWEPLVWAVLPARSWARAVIDRDLTRATVIEAEAELPVGPVAGIDRCPSLLDIEARAAARS